MINLFEKFDFTEAHPGVGTGRGYLGAGEIVTSHSPVHGRPLGTIRTATGDDCEQVLSIAARAFEQWRGVPAPKRGEIVRQIGETLRQHKKDLAKVICLEVGKIRAEAEGEVQEMIDMADFAVGQSRMLYGQAMHSERAGHRMYEQWHPLGPTGVITAFNFPGAVWAWNAFIAMIAGNTVVWKPSSKAVLSALAVMKIIWPVLNENDLPEGILNLVIGDRLNVGEMMIRDPRLPLISATGSVGMGRHVAQAVSARFGKSILELGGNNAIILTPRADLGLAARAILFGAVGTAGQRCTTTRRVIVHDSVYDDLAAALIKSYGQLKIGNPLGKNVHMGPLINRRAVKTMQNALSQVKWQGGTILFGGDVLSGGIHDTGTYVSPCICHAEATMPIVREETFAPILYLVRYKKLDDAIHYQNDVPQGLSSAIFTRDLAEAEYFLSHGGSDCGIANVNLGTSGAEIGGAFGGEKETGGGREAGSDAWKAYMRCQTCTVNWSAELPLAQGIRFNVGEKS
jgi:L-aminoadipate-semialdehyde dehydrogenase